MTTTDIDRLLDEAIARQQAGLLAEAETAYRQVLDADPENTDALNLLGLLCQNRGDHLAAQTFFERALAVDPDFPEALTNHARACNLFQRYDEAKAASARATALDPELGEAWEQLGFAHLWLRDAQEAFDAFRVAERFMPDSVQVQEGLSEAAKLLKNHLAVAEALTNVLAAKPDHVPTIIDLSIALTADLRLDDAAALQRHAMALDPDNQALMAATAHTLFLQRYDLAMVVTLCRRLLEINPENTKALAMLASTLGWQGRFEESEAVFAKLLEIDPDQENAQSVLTLYKSDAGKETDLVALRARFDNEQLTRVDRVAAGFAIGKNLERAGDYDGAFAAYEAANTMNANALTAGERGFKRDEMRRYVDWATASFTDGIFERLLPFGNRSEVPVFIVGMPRSGTSLIEQIAASHPAVFGGGERRDIENIMDRITRGPSPTIPQQWDYEMMRLEARQHIVNLTEIGKGVPRVIDKLPDNIFFLGQIALMFPNARVIVLRRDLRDVCVSCFTNHFVDSFNWASNLDDLGFRVTQVERLMDHWRQVIPLRMLEVSYESLVGNLEEESRKLIDFLGLEWDPACLEYHKTERAVATVSYMQIRQPIYGSSIGRWKRFEPHLRPLTKILEEHGLVAPAS